MMQELSDWLATALAFLGPAPFLQILGAVAGFLLLAVAVDVLAGLLLRRAFRQWPAQAAEQLVRLARQPVFSSIFLLGLLLAFSVIALPVGPARFIDSLVATLLIGIWVVFGVRATGVILAALSRRQPVPAFAQPTTATLMRNTIVVVLGLAGAYGILLAWNVNVTGLVASAGILGLALSFAAQDTLGNLIAGISILTDKPYRIGDYIVLDSGERGAVTHIGLRSTRLLTRDDVEVSIPNGVMGKAKIVNESGSPQRRYRLRVPATVAYGSDIDQVMALMLAAAADHRQVCIEPEPRMRLRQFGSSGLEFEMLCWIEEPANRGLVLHELNCTLYRVFAREGVVLAIPQQEIHLRNGVARGLDGGRGAPRPLG
jgi:small-conductance mechanosensitive channel